MIASHVATHTCQQRSPRVAVGGLYQQAGNRVSIRCSYRSRAGRFPAFDYYSQVMSMPKPVRAALARVHVSLTGWGWTSVSCGGVKEKQSKEGL